MFKLSDLEQKLKFCFTVIGETLKLLGKSAQYHRHIQSETFFKDLLNIGLGYNLDCQPFNAKAIDLYEKDTGICFQVTTVDTNLKKSETIRKLEELIAEQKSFNVTELNILVLNMTEKPDLSNKPTFHFSQKFTVNIFNLQDIASRIFNENRNNQQKIGQIIKFLTDQTNVFDFLQKSQYIPLPEEISESYVLSGTGRLPIYASNYWGLNRNCFVGVYINQLEDAEILNEMVSSEVYLKEASVEKNKKYAVRTWFEFSPRQLVEASTTIKDLTVIYDCFRNPEPTEIIGLFLNFKTDPAESFVEYLPYVGQWCLQFDKFEFGPLKNNVAMIFNFNVPFLTEQRLEQIAVLKKYLEVHFSGREICVLSSLPRKSMPPPLVYGNSDDLFGLSPGDIYPAAGINPGLTPVFSYLHQLFDAWRVRFRAPQSFFNDIPSLKRLCTENHLLYCQIGREGLAVPPETDIVAFLTALDSYTRDPSQKNDILTEIFSLTHLLMPYEETAQLINLCAGSGRIEQLVSLEFALLQSSSHYLDIWVNCRVHQRSAIVLRLDLVKEEAIILALMRFLHTKNSVSDRDIQEAGMLLEQYCNSLNPSHIFHRFMQDEPFELLRNMTNIETYQFTCSGLYQRLNLPVGEFFKRIAVAPYPGLLWKCLFFNQKITGEKMKELISNMGLRERAVAGLCTKEELNSIVYKELEPYVNECRNFDANKGTYGKF